MKATALKAVRNLDWNYELEESLETHLRTIKEYFHSIYPTILQNAADACSLDWPVVGEPDINASDEERRAFDDHCDRLNNYRMNEQYRHDSEIPFYILASTFLYVCTATEGWLTYICDELSAYGTQKEKRNDYASEWALGQCFLYLFFGLKFNVGDSSDNKSLTSIFENLRGQFAIRNAIAHCSLPLLFGIAGNSNIEKHRKRIIALKAGFESRYGGIMFNAQYVLESIDRGICLSEAIRKQIPSL